MHLKWGGQRHLMHHFLEVCFQYRQFRKSKSNSVFSTLGSQHSHLFVQSLEQLLSEGLFCTWNMTQLMLSKAPNLMQERVSEKGVTVIRTGIKCTDGSLSLFFTFSPLLYLLWVFHSLPLPSLTSVNSRKDPDQGLTGSARWQQGILRGWLEPGDQEAQAAAGSLVQPRPEHLWSLGPEHKWRPLTICGNT